MLNGTNYVTMATDGSTNNTSRCGMAYYIRDDDGIMKDSWYVEGAYTSTYAEWMALEKALYVLEKRRYPVNTKLIYYCDNMTMLRILGEGFDSRKAVKRWQVKRTWALFILKDFYSIETRHVKAHAHGTSARYYLNRWCDYNCRAMMRHGRLHQENG